MAAEYTPEALDELTRRVHAHLHRWGLPPTTAVELLNVSENATYALDVPGGSRCVLRLHRVGYSSAEEIAAELSWMAALRRDGAADTAAPLPGRDGRAVQRLESVPLATAEGGARMESGVRTEGRPRVAVAAAGTEAEPAEARPVTAARFAVLFERLPGKEPDASEAASWFERLGEITARMHGHARAWVRPAGFARKRWDFAAMVGDSGFWGPWRAGIGLEAAGAAVIERALSRVHEQLEALGHGPGVFGLIHADMRLANLLVDGDRLRIIDFDDCGFSWFLYDFATAVSFIEHEPQVPALLRAWVRGYGRVQSLSAAEVALLPTFVILRRVLLTAWLASHAEVPFAREMGAAYTRGTVALAQQWLDGRYLASG